MTERKAGAIRSKPVVAVDIDNTILLYTSAFIVWHNANYGTQFKLEQFVDYCFSPMLECSDEEALNRVDLFSKTNAFACAEEIEGAMDAMVKIDAMGYEIVLVTTRASSTKDVIDQWLAFHWRPQLLLKNRYEMPRIMFCEGRRKVDICADLGAVAMIDDSPDVLRECVWYNTAISLAATTSTDSTTAAVVGTGGAGGAVHQIKPILFNFNSLHNWAVLGKPGQAEMDRKIIYCTTWAEIVAAI